jgi:peroxiredoxin
LYERYHTQGLEILGVSMYYDPPNLVVEFNKLRPLPYLLTLDIEAKFSKAFGNVNVTPTTFLLNSKGKIIWQKVGLIERSELQPLIEKLLQEK